MYETEQRLRSYLNGKQAEREKLCAAILPTLGNYSSIAPRRPEGGPDGARDIECIFNGAIVTWGGIGFRNDASSSTEDRTWAQRKFASDLDSALTQNPALQGFVFFTNVDLTPDQCEGMKHTAFVRKLSHVDVFDFHRLRNGLDQPAGLLARLQYLDIEMTREEQLALVRAFGEELQKTVTSGFNRMDTALRRLERFLDVRKPLTQLALVFTLDQPLAQFATSPQLLLVSLHGLWPASSNCLLLCARAVQDRVDGAVVAELQSWVVQETTDGTPPNYGDHLGFASTRSTLRAQIAASYSISFGAGGGALHFGDVTAVTITIFASPAVACHTTRVQLDMNGYTVVTREPMCQCSSPKYVPDGLKEEALHHILTHRTAIVHETLSRSALTFTSER